MPSPSAAEQGQGQRAGAWQPLLTGTIASEARAAIAAIAEQVQAQPPSLADPASLAGGRAGQALLYGYLACASDDAPQTAPALRLLGEAVDVVAAQAMEPSLYSGFTGVAWVASHLHGYLTPAADDPAAAIDELLLKHLERPHWQHTYDLVSGLVGYGVYALERLPRPAAVACLARVVAHLAASAQPQPAGLTWWTNPRWLPAAQRARAPHGYYNLGLAHGVPGVIALLGHACAAGIAETTARPLLAGAVDWLLRQRLPDQAGSRFPGCVEPGRQPEASRLGWCYGDLGVALALLVAARSVGEAAWERAALELGAVAAARTPQNGAIHDAGLCHGSAGVGHLFNRLHQASGHSRFAAAAHFWFEHTLRLRRLNSGLAGFLALEYDPDGARQWQPSIGFLTGASGVALALLAATSSVAPEWDRVLLADLAPR